MHYTAERFEKLKKVDGKCYKCNALKRENGSVAMEAGNTESVGGEQRWWVMMVKAMGGCSERVGLRRGACSNMIDRRRRPVATWRIVIFRLLSPCVVVAAL